MTDKTQEQAQRDLTRAGLQVSTTFVTGGEPSDQVETQEPAAGVEVKKSTVVNLTVRTGAVVPDLRGDPAAKAEEKLRDQGFTRIVTTPKQDSAAVGSVVEQDPPAGQTVDPTGTQTLSIAAPRLVQIPTLRLEGFWLAAEDLNRSGFEVRMDMRAGCPAVRERPELYTVVHCSVQSVSPRVGDYAAPGSVVTLS